MENEEQRVPIQLTVSLPKGTAILPSWILILFASLFVVASLGLLVTIFVETQMMKEVRVMQMYEQDIENVLIRSGIATRSDFSYHPPK